ncbi:MAG: nucleotide sugar dehydrogenase [Bacteroidetes bacterium]|nr:nucleotide sugar dehydrogenase [Bacteroidota bacterium]MBL6944395.1 nucleotide sugar dehydrogenase [Bacteroidales bacterium]
MKKITIIGLGYVGLPLAVEFAKKTQVVGFDINQARVDELASGHDSTLETEDKVLQSVLQNNNFDSASSITPSLHNSNNPFPKKTKGLFLTTNSSELTDSQIYIVTVPTPIDDNKRPDLTPLIKASETVGKVIKKGDIVIYESTVYPGATEEVCLPVIEKVSGLKFNEDFYAGYSPERINPGDKVNTLTKIKKVTSGSTPEIADEVDDLYNTILENGTFKASSLKVAEASKVIENAQRDLNISFVNELALIFDRIGIDTNDVIEAAGSKWNFLKYKPGLVGGHCIGVDPYYLAFKAESLGYYPEVIYSGRRVNEFMPRFVANKVVKLMIKKGQKILNSKVLLLGITFKENCPDIRNTRVVDIVDELQAFGCNVDIYDPWANPDEVYQVYGIQTLETNVDIYAKSYDAIILAVSHEQFINIDFSRLVNGNHAVIFDIKGVLPKDIVDGRL